MKKVCFVVSSEATVTKALLDHIAALGAFCVVSVAANTRDTGFLTRHGLPTRVFAVPVERRISPCRDLRALLSLVRLFRRERFDAVHSITPKAGLLSAVAGRLAGVPIRVHTFTGQVWATRRGAARQFLKTLDRLLASLLTHILADSPSQRDFLVSQGVVAREKAAVLANGSICGVDLARFRPDPEIRAAVRREFRIPETDIVFLFVGRINRDKGVLDLADAFARLRAVNERVRLMLVGPDEEEMLPRIRQRCADCADAVSHVGFTDLPERYMAAADVLCLPSYREGFGSVVIEAAAAGIPAIATRIYGVVDALDDGVTGVLYEAGNVSRLAEEMARFAADRALGSRMGENARRRAAREFPKEMVTAAMAAYYRTLLAGG